jgi:hypothetical protein
MKTILRRFVMVLPALLFATPVHAGSGDMHIGDYGYATSQAMRDANEADIQRSIRDDLQRQLAAQQREIEQLRDERDRMGAPSPFGGPYGPGPYYQGRR